MDSQLGEQRGQVLLRGILGIAGPPVGARVLKW